MATTKREQLEQARVQLADLQGERARVQAALANARAELDVVVDEGRAVELTGLVAARSNRVGQLERQIAAAERDLVGFVRQAARERQSELDAQIAAEMAGYADQLWSLFTAAERLLELDKERLQALLTANGDRVSTLQSLYGADLGDVRSILTRHKLGRPAYHVQRGPIYERVQS